MKSTIVCFVLVGLLAATYGLPAKGSTKAALKKKPCLRVCDTGEYKPVCAGDGTGKNVSFGSTCVLENYNCENGKNLQVQSEGECPGSGGVRLS